MNEKVLAYEVMEKMRESSNNFSHKVSYYTNRQYIHQAIKTCDELHLDAVKFLTLLLRRAYSNTIELGSLIRGEILIAAKAYPDPLKSEITNAINEIASRIDILI